MKKMKLEFLTLLLMVKMVTQLQQMLDSLAKTFLLELMMTVLDVQLESGHEMEILLVRTGGMVEMGELSHHMASSRTNNLLK